jgi:transcriptional regulator with XRE-family HTH domain
MDGEAGSVEAIEDADIAADGPSFGAYLNTLLTERDLTPRALANMLELDLSLVYKWLRGERTPRFNSVHADHIAEALDLPPSERRALNESQVRSLRVRPAQRPHPAPRSRVLDAPVASLIGRRMLPVTERAPLRPSVTSAEMTLAEGAVRGPQAALRATVEILASAPPPRVLDPDQSILLTWQGAGALDPFDPPFGPGWTQALRGALARGWRARQIWRLNRDVHRSVTLVRTMLDLLGAGQYESFFVPTHETLPAPYDLLIVPGHAAALFFATAEGAAVDSALVTRDPAQIALFTAHFGVLAKHAQKLLEASPRTMATRFDEAPAPSDLRVPGRRFVQHALSLMTELAEWSSEESFWAERMRGMGRAGRALTQMINHRRERQSALLAHAETTGYRDIATMEAVEAIALRGEYLRHAAIRPTNNTKGAPAAERRAHLTNAIDVLRRYPHYQLALLDEREAQELQVTRETYWEVLGAQRALINTRSLDSEDQPVDLDITLDEPSLVAAFVEHFESHWSRIAPEHRDKAWVIAWLEGQVRAILDGDDPPPARA